MIYKIYLFLRRFLSMIWKFILIIVEELLKKIVLMVTIYCVLCISNSHTYTNVFTIDTVVIPLPLEYKNFSLKKSLFLVLIYILVLIVLFLFIFFVIFFISLFFQLSNIFSIICSIVVLFIPATGGLIYFIFLLPKVFLDPKLIDNPLFYITHMHFVFYLMLILYILSIIIRNIYFIVYFNERISSLGMTLLLWLFFIIQDYLKLIFNNSIEDKKKDFKQLINWIIISKFFIMSGQVISPEVTLSNISILIRDFCLIIVFTFVLIYIYFSIFYNISIFFKIICK